MSRLEFRRRILPSLDQVPAIWDSDSDPHEGLYLFRERSVGGTWSRSPQPKSSKPQKTLTTKRQLQSNYGSTLIGESPRCAPLLRPLLHPFSYSCNGISPAFGMHESDHKPNTREPQEKPSRWKDSSKVTTEACRARNTRILPFQTSIDLYFLLFLSSTWNHRLEEYSN